jgi:hypothetical protein
MKTRSALALEADVDDAINYVDKALCEDRSPPAGYSSRGISVRWEISDQVVKCMGDDRGERW